MKKLLNTKLKDMKAITLVALVITIVTLIVLAGVLISLTLGDNGIFQRAKKAKEDYANAAEYEETEIAKTANEIDNFVGGGRNEYQNYSEDEQIIGKWINNENLWRKVVKYNSSTGKAVYNIPHNISNLKQVVDIKAMGLWTSEDENVFTKLPNMGTCLQVRGSNIQYESQGFTCDKLIIILEYTKND